MKVKFYGDGTEELTCHPNGDLHNGLLQQIRCDNSAKDRVRTAFGKAKKVENLVAKFAEQLGNEQITMDPQGVLYFNVVPQKMATVADNNLSIDVYAEDMEESSHQCFECGRYFTTFIGLQRHCEAEGHDFKSLSDSLVPNILKFFAPGPVDILGLTDFCFTDLIFFDFCRSIFRNIIFAH